MIDLGSRHEHKYTKYKLSQYNNGCMYKEHLKLNSQKKLSKAEDELKRSFAYKKARISIWPFQVDFKNLIGFAVVIWESVEPAPYFEGIKLQMM